MALIKKIDVDKYFAARRAMRLGRIGPVSRPVRPGPSPPLREREFRPLPKRSH